MSLTDWWHRRTPAQQKTIIKITSSIVVGCIFAAFRASKKPPIVSELLPAWGDADTPSHYFDQSEIFDTDIFD